MTEQYDDLEVKNKFESDEPATPTRPRREASHLDRLKALFAIEVVTAPCNVLVPLRKGMSLDIEVEGLTVDAMERYSKKATHAVGKSNRRSRRNGQSEEKMDNLELASLVLHNHCVGIRIDGELVEDENGVALTLADDEIQSLLNVVSEDDVSAIMTEVFVMDIHVLNAFMELQDYLEDISDGDDDDSPLER